MKAPDGRVIRWLQRQEPTNHRVRAHLVTRFGADGKSRRAEAVMPLRSPTVCTFREPLVLDPKCVAPGTVPWLLAHHRDKLFPAFLVDEWRGCEVNGRAAGRAAWPADLLFGLLVLRWSEEGTSRLASCRRAKTDLAWRAALGLPIGVGGQPSEKTMREFEAWLIERSRCSDVPRHLLVHEHIVRLVLSVLDEEPVWAMDSTPMWCFGALRGTLRLLADGLRRLVRFVRRHGAGSKRLDEQVAGLSWLTSKSAKGGMACDWSDEDARAAATDHVARGVLDVIQELPAVLTGLNETVRKQVQERAEILLRIIETDLEEDERGRLVVARNVARDRIVSLTDPEARSGRKTRAQPFKGFKIHVLGDVVSRLIIAVDVVAANAPEATAGHELIRVARRVRHELGEVLADTAYGATQVRVALREEGIDLVAPPPAAPHLPGRALPKEVFTIDFERETATCPAGVTSADYRPSETLPKFVWPYTTCSTCDRAMACLPVSLRKPPSATGRPRTNGRVVVLHSQEQDLREARRQWEKPSRRVKYRRRTEAELLVHDIVRHGGRRARAYRLARARLQVQAIAIRCNLALLARRLHQRGDHRFPDRNAGM